MTNEEKLADLEAEIVMAEAELLELRTLRTKLENKLGGHYTCTWCGKRNQAKYKGNCPKCPKVAIQ